MTEAAMATPPAPRRVKLPTTAWMSMDPDGDTPPPQDGKWLWLTPDGESITTAVEAVWKNTSRFERTANGGRGGWIAAGWWAYRFPPGKKIEFEPKGWRARND